MFRVGAEHLQVDRALVEQQIGQPLDEHRVDDGRSDGGMAEHVLLDAGRVHDR